jgi:hypothetical protein
VFYGYSKYLTVTDNLLIFNVYNPTPKIQFPFSIAETKIGESPADKKNTK